MRKIQEVNVHLVIIRHIWGIHGSIRGGNPYQCTVGIFVHLHGIKKMCRSQNKVTKLGDIQSISEFHPSPRTRE